MSEIDRYLDAVMDAFDTAGDIVPWPMHVAEATSYCADLEALDLLAILETADLEAEEIADLWIGTSSPKTMMLDLIVGLKLAGVSPDRRVWFVEKIFDAVARREAGDVFCADGSHRPLGASGAQHLADSLSWRSYDPDADRVRATAVWRLSAACHAVVYAHFFYGWTDIGLVIHGPYDVTDPSGHPSRMLVRDFIDLRPVDLWPRAAELPIDQLRIATLHDADVDLRVDVMNHLVHSEALGASTRGTAVSSSTSLQRAEIEDAGDLAEQAVPLTERLLEAVERQNLAVQELDRHDLVTKFVESRYYGLRNWRRAVGMDWRPPDEVHERIRDWAPIILEDSAHQDPAVLRAGFDPRLVALP